MQTSDLTSVIPCFPVYDGWKPREILGGYTSDLLSDVMSKAREGFVLVTIQAHKNTVAVASMLGLAAVILCNSRPVPPEMVEAAKDECIPLFSTQETQFEVSGRLWSALREVGPSRTEPC